MICVLYQESMSNKCITALQNYYLLLFIVFDTFVVPSQMFPLLMVTPFGSGGYSLDDNEVETFILTAAVTEFFYLVRK